tara:strand:+ start:75 stop:338 length:264 start_codon:yes stop_codon:yes gene_type:complete
MVENVRDTAQFERCAHIWRTIMDNKKEIKILEFRIFQLELALGSLMQVVAFPENNKDFRGRMEEALEIADGNNRDLLEMILDEGAEA